MSAVCRFCSRKFANAQAVRAHLKGCVPYHEHRRARRASGRPALGKAHSLGNSLGKAPEFPGYPDQTELDRDDHYDVEPQSVWSRSADDARLTRGRPELESPAAQQRGAASPRRREIIQEVKQQCIREMGAVLWPRPETTAEVLQAIERAFAGLEVEELPREELLAIARSERDRLYRIAEQNEKDARNAESLNRKQALELEDRKTRLIKQGLAYAKQELEAVDDINAHDRWRIERSVEKELRGIDGNESWDEIEDLVEDILASEGIEDDDADNDGD